MLQGHVAACETLGVITSVGPLACVGPARPVSTQAPHTDIEGTSEAKVFGEARA